jgi:hypothetical protein
LPERPSSACSSSTLGRSTDLRTRGLSPGRVRIENLCLSTSRSSCSPTLPDGQAIAADTGSDKPVPADLQSARDGYSHCSSFPQGTATSRREAAMAADAGLVRGLPTTPAVISSPDCLPCPPCPASAPPRRESSYMRDMARKRAFRIGRSRTGLGLFATAPVKNGAFIVEYTAAII